MLVTGRSRFDLGAMGAPTQIYAEQDDAGRRACSGTTCGADLCVLDATAAGGGQRLLRIDPSTGTRRWTDDVPGAASINGFGTSVLVNGFNGGSGVRLYTADGALAYTDPARGGSRSDRDTALVIPWGTALPNTPVTGLNPDGSAMDLGDASPHGFSSDIDHTSFVCADTTHVVVYRFRT